MHFIKNEYLTIAISERGAELMSVSDMDRTEYIWQGGPAHWTGRALNIFPYVARLNAGKYRIDGKEYSLPIHGFAPYMTFIAMKKTDTEIEMELTEDADTLKMYPRRFSFSVKYSLDERRLEITYRVENRDQRIMYFGLGGHPGFNVPLAKGEYFNSYRLRFTEKCRPYRIGFTPQRFLDGSENRYQLEDDHLLRLDHKIFSEDAVVLRNVSHEVILETERDSHSVRVSFPQMNYLGIWHTPNTEAPFVCIEPWCSLPAFQDKVTVFEEQSDLIALAPGEIYRNVWSIEFGR